MQQSVTRLLAVLLAAVLFLLPGCGAAGGEPEETTLVYGSGDYTSINPALYEHGEVNLLLFSGLTARDGENKIIPGLAEKWEYDRDSLTYTFTLRKGVKWHDGEPFTAADVKFTLEAILAPENLSEIASNYEDIAAIETPDDHTVRIRLSSPNAAMLDYLAIGILPKHLLEGKDLVTAPFNQAPVGTGPYKLVSWDAGQSIVLERNPDYYAGTPKIGRIIFKIVPDEKARAMQLRSGELDLAQVSPQDARSFGDAEGFTVYDMKTSDYRGVLYNFSHPLFAKYRELPNALSYAVDRQAIVDSVLLGKGRPAYSPLQSGPYNNPAVEKFQYDPVKTRAMLEAAGWRQGSDGVYQKDGDRLAFTIHCPEGDPVRVDMANICAQQFSEAGADVTVSIDSEIDWAGQAAYLIGWGSPFDPDDHTYKVFGTGQAANYGNYSNPRVDDLLGKARGTDVSADRMKYYQAFQEALTDDLPYTFLAYADAVYVAKDRVQGIAPDTVLGHHGVGIFWNVKDWTLA